MSTNNDNIAFLASGGTQGTVLCVDKQKDLRYAKAG